MTPTPEPTMYNGTSRLGALPEADGVDLLLHDLLPDRPADAVRPAGAGPVRPPTVRGAVTLKSFLGAVNWHNAPVVAANGRKAETNGTTPGAGPVRGSVSLKTFFGSVNWTNDPGAVRGPEPDGAMADRASFVLGAFISEFNWD